MNTRVAAAIKARDELVVWQLCPLPDLDEPNITESRRQWRDFLLAKNVEYNALSAIINDL
jgi:hypothetical protein